MTLLGKLIQKQDEKKTENQLSLISLFFITLLFQRVFTINLVWASLFLISSTSFSSTLYEISYNPYLHSSRAVTPYDACQLKANYVFGSASYEAINILIDSHTDYYCRVISHNGDFNSFFGYIYPIIDDCPTNYIDNGTGQCIASDLKADSKQATASCSASKGPNPRMGDPIIVATGNSFQTEVDYQSQSPFGLSFVRYYNSSANAIDKGIGKQWQHQYQQKINASETEAQVSRSNGQTFVFNLDNSNWLGDVDISDTLVETVDGSSNRTGWVYTTSNDTVETYNAIGQLLILTNRAGQSQTFAYDVTIANGGDDNNDTLDKVTGFTGEILLLSYNPADTAHPKRIISITGPQGHLYHYHYDAASNLTSIIYPDNTPLDDNDNPTRTYHYENTNFPSHLTGLTDETGSRVTWVFDSEGRAISSELDGGVDKSTLDFSVADQVTVTNPLGKDTTYHFTTLHGVKKVTSVEGRATQSCAGANQSYTYDANGYIQSKTDWQGNITTYIHDARGLETSRTEASNTPEARTITTQWHTTFRLPVSITEPGKVTDFVYDGQGRLLSQTTHTAP